MFGTKYLCRTPFLIDLSNGLSLNPERQFASKTHVQFMQTNLTMPMAPRMRPDVRFQGPELTSSALVVQGIDVARNLEDSGDTIGSGTN